MNDAILILMIFGLAIFTVSSIMVIRLLEDIVYGVEEILRAQQKRDIR